MGYNNSLRNEMILSYFSYYSLKIKNVHFNVFNINLQTYMSFRIIILLL